MSQLITIRELHLQWDKVVGAVKRGARAVRTVLPPRPCLLPTRLPFVVLLLATLAAPGVVVAGVEMPRLAAAGFAPGTTSSLAERWLQELPRQRAGGRIEPTDRAESDGLMRWAISRPWLPSRQPVGQSLLFDRPVGELPVVGDARWSAPLTGATFGAVAVWIVLLAALQAAGLPLARLLLRGFDDEGSGFARLIALLAAGYLVWIGSSLELVAFRAVWCAMALGVVAVIGLLALRRTAPRSPRRHMRWPVVVGAETTFWGVFGIFLLFRFLNPDGWHPIWGGEKPMEFAHLNATLRSAHFPPYDPWFADGYLNYYYYGTYLVAFLLKLTGIPSELGFNLAQPTMMALLASGVFSLAATIGRGLSRRGAMLAGTVAVLLAVLVGNLTTAHRLFLAIVSSVPPRFDSFLDWTWAGSRAIEGTITEFPFFTGLYADLHAHVVALPITVLAIALAYALVLEPIGSSLDRRPTTLLRLVGLALVLGTLGATNAWDVPVYAMLAVAALWMASRAELHWWRRLVVFAVGALAMAIAAYALFLPFHSQFVALFGSLAPVQAPTSLSEWGFHAGGLVAIAASALVTLLLPRSERWWFGWIRPSVLLLFVGLATFLSSLALVVFDTEPLIPGATAAAVAAAFVLAAGWQVPNSSDRLDRVPVFVGALVALAAFASDRAVLGLAVAGLAAAGSGWLNAPSIPVRFWCLLVAAATGVIAGAELVVVADDLIGTSAYRMNTVFKFYNQVWILLAIAAGTGVAAMATVAATRRSRRRASTSSAASFTRAPVASRISSDSSLGPSPLPENKRALIPATLRRSWARFGLAVALLVGAASLLYPVFAVGPRLAQRIAEAPSLGTLDALAWMEYGSVPAAGGALGRIQFAGDRAAIDWFNREVPGSPVIAEASIGPYRCNGSRISNATGLPTVIGWERHQTQQRLATELPSRVADVERLYRSPNPAEKERILRRYNIAYVVVGDIERSNIRIDGNDCIADPRPAGIAAFEEMVGETIEVAFEEQGTVVYHVLSNDLRRG